MVSEQHQYLEKVLAKYNLTEKQIESLQNKRKGVEDFLRAKYGSKIQSVNYSGSYAKGTAVNLKYDLDVCVFFHRDGFDTLPNMYNSVYETMKGYGPVEKQKVSIRLSSGSESIDVVPARRIDDTSTDANLYVTTTGGQIKTNTARHKEYISESGCRPVIKLMKVWKYQRGIHYKSFALELLTIKALSGFGSEDYSERVLHTLKYIRDNVETIRLIDPANSNNNVADLIEVSDKRNMKLQADSSLSQSNWGSIIW